MDTRFTQQFSFNDILNNFKFLYIVSMSALFVSVLLYFHSVFILVLSSSCIIYNVVQ